MGNQESRVAGDGEAYKALARGRNTRSEPYGENFPREFAFVKGEAKAGTRNEGASTFAKATEGKQTAVAITSVKKLSVSTEGSSSRALASNQGVAVAAGNSSAKAHTHRLLSTIPPPQSLQKKRVHRSRAERDRNHSSALTRVTPTSTAIFAQPTTLNNALVASRGDGSAFMTSTGEAEAGVATKTGSARIFKKKNDFIIESHGTGQAGRTGKTMWVLDGDNMAMAHLASDEAGGIFCPCSMKQDAALCFCPCHGGGAVGYDHRDHRADKEREDRW